MREDTHALDDVGFLLDPDAAWFGTSSVNPNAVRTSQLAKHRSLVLLGEPGSGKSTTLQAAPNFTSADVPIAFFNLASFGSEERLTREIFEGPAITEWSGGTTELCLVLDSLDEARAHIPNIGALIADRLRRLPCDRLQIRIACRTADWPSGLEQAMDELFGATAVMEILPLRRADASRIAATWCDADSLLEQIEAVGVGPLAARPLTLKLLARGFAATGELPGRGAATYVEGIRALCEEQSPTRRDAGLGGALTLDQRVATARRIAAASVFGGASAIWIGPEADADSESLIGERLIGWTEPTDVGMFDVGPSAIREVLHTALFTGRGRHRLGWAHATFSDFLAAEWVVTNRLSKPQARSLFLGPDNRCWPQTRLTAAWVVALSPDRYAFLTTADPEAFLGEVELPGDELRAAVIDGLFSRAELLTTERWRRPYRSLGHRDIAEQIRSHLHDTDAHRRRLAIDLADECGAIELRRDLEAITLDTDADLNDRIAAGWALTRLAPPHQSSALRPLALGTAAREDDPDDDLKGVALLATWPHSLSNKDVFNILTPRRNTNYHGAYSAFLHDFRASIAAEDVGSGLEWLLGNLESPRDDFEVGALANRILTLAASCPLEPSVINAFATIVRARSEHDDQLLFDDHLDSERDDPLASPGFRHEVALAAFRKEVEPWSLLSQGVVRTEDLIWLADIYMNADTEVRTTVLSLFAGLFDAQNPVHRDYVLSMPREHPLHIDLVHAWVDPVRLDSPEAEQQREIWSRRRRRTTDVVPDDIVDRIEELLTRFDAGEGVGFWSCVRLLTIAPGAKHYGAEFDPDVTGMKRWPTLNARLREHLVDAAENYLRYHPCEPQQWLGRPDIRYFPAEAGYRAMMILLRAAPERLQTLPETAWVEWAPVLASTTTAIANGATWEDKAQMLGLAGPRGRDAARSALLTHVTATVAAQKRPFASNEAQHLWDESVATCYLSLLATADLEPCAELVESLSDNDFDQVREQLLTWLKAPSDAERRQLAGSTLAARDLGRSWPDLRASFDADTALAEIALGRALNARAREDNTVPSSVLADIYLWLRAAFPPESDPQFEEAHFVGPREQIGRWRDQILVHLRDTGSADSVDALRAVVHALPDDRWLPRTLALAEAALRRNQWTPTPLRQLTRLATNPGSLVVNDETSLSAATTSALAGIQRRLTGATPESHYLWDTYAGRPKTEDQISDYLSNELNRALSQRRVIVNREVQVRRNKPSGVGERTDLLVEAFSADSRSTERLMVPIEVKGAWNSELQSALNDQLVARYMSDLGTRNGVFVVVWPELTAWTDMRDERRRALTRLDREAIATSLSTQAAEHERANLHIAVIHLSIDYLRPR